MAVSNIFTLFSQTADTDYTRVERLFFSKIDLFFELLW